MLSFKNFSNSAGVIELLPSLASYTSRYFPNRARGLTLTKCIRYIIHVNRHAITGKKVAVSPKIQCSNCLCRIKVKSWLMVVIPGIIVGVRRQRVLRMPSRTIANLDAAVLTKRNLTIRECDTALGK